MKTVYTTLFLLMAASLSNCKKFIDVDPPVTSTSTESAYREDLTASAVVTGLYAQLSRQLFTQVGLTSTSAVLDLYADNLTIFDINSTNPGVRAYTSYYRNILDPTYLGSTTTYWRSIYTMLYTINDSINRLTGNTYLSPKVDKRLLGEVYFLRAFCYFYLVNIYGDVPLITSTKHDVNEKATRTVTSVVYNQILQDLNQAEGLLDNTYVTPDINITTERLRPNLSAVNAMQARIYLYLKRYAEAEASATKVISQTSVYSLSLPGNLNSVFLKNSTETIWALAQVTTGYNTREGALFLLPYTGPNGSTFPMYASSSLVSSFQDGDDRKVNWLSNVTVDIGASSNTYYYPTKYKLPFISGNKTLTEYTIVFRLAEQYLIRAEARNELNNPTGAVDDINSIRRRARASATATVPDPLPDLKTTLSKGQINTAILHERRVELFTEWGHRFFDLKRTGNLDAAMAEAVVAKGTSWASYKALHPIPVGDILLNAAITQNPGYSN